LNSQTLETQGGLESSPKVLLLVRGLPGSGKSSLAKYFAEETLRKTFTCSADDFFTNPFTKEYKFIPSKIGEAHEACQVATRFALSHEGDVLVVVHNTSTTENEVETYKTIAEEAGAAFVSIVVENRHGNPSIHGVPEETLGRMKARFSIKL